MSAEARHPLRDPALRGLATLLDADAFAARLRALVPGADILGVRGEYVRYKPGARCIALYRVTLPDAEVRVHGIAHGADAPEKLAKRSARPVATGLLGNARLACEDLALAIDVFPDDARLRTLRRLESVEFRNHLLTRLRVLAPGATVQRLTLLAYKPERRFVARVDRDDGTHALLKLHTPERFQILPVMSGFSSGRVLRVARMLHASRRHAACAYQWIDGHPLALFAADAEAALARSGEALAELHAQTPAQRERRPGPEVLASAALVAVLVPKLAAPVRALAEQLAERLAAGSSPRRALHGDFHAAQVLLDGDSAALLDLDNACAGDPAQDLAVFAAHAELEAIRSQHAPARVATALERLLAGYARVAPPPDTRRIALHTAAALVSIAPQPFRNFDPAWPERIEVLLDRANAWFAQAGRAPAGTPTPTHRTGAPAAIDPALPLLAEALDRDRVAAALARALGDPGLALHGARLIRHKPGRRALVRYDVTTGAGEPASLLGKLRARGPDRTAFRVQHTLHRSGFGDDAPDGISVPAALGAVPDLFLWLQRKVPGAPLTARLGQPGDVGLCERAATALHKLHETPIETARQHGVSDEVELLCGRLLPQLAQTHPELRWRVERLAAACRQLAAAIPDAPHRGIHRDFHPDQVLVDGARMWLVDFDLYCLGHPALDAGNFVAHLTELALRRHGDPSALLDCEHAFEERFLALSGRELEPALRNFTLLSLARHVLLSTRYEDRRETTEPLLALCEERLGLGGAAFPEMLRSAAQ